MAAVLSGLSLHPIGEMYQFMGNGYLDTERQQLRIYKDEMPVAGISRADCPPGGSGLHTRLNHRLLVG